MLGKTSPPGAFTATGSDKEKISLGPNGLSPGRVMRVLQRLRKPARHFARDIVEQSSRSGDDRVKKRTRVKKKGRVDNERKDKRPKMKNSRGKLMPYRQAQIAARG